MRRALVVLALVVGGALPARAVELPEPRAGLTLAAALDRALERNPVLLAARSDVARAEAELAVARMSPLRSVSASIGLNTFAGNNPLSPMGGAVVAVNVGDLLSTPFGVRGAEARLEAARQALRQTTLAVASATTEAYLAWGTRKQQLALRQEAIRSSQSEVAVIERQFGKGTATVGDLLKVKLAASQSQTDLVAAEGEAKRAWLTLLAQMGETDWLEPAR